MRRSRIAPWLAAGLVAACGKAPTGAADAERALLGGGATVFDDSKDAFNYAARNLSTDKRGPFQLGDSIFNRNWVTAPATPQGNDGLGPTFNALSCSGCHGGNGRGSPPEQAAEPFLGLVLRLSVPGADDRGGPLPEPTYGVQFNHRSILGVPSEGAASVSYEEVPGTFADGEPYSLRRPTYAFGELHFGPMDPRVQVSPRIARQLIGLGLLQAVSEETIRGFTQRSDGHPNLVWDIRQQRMTLGRFGWKASEPTVQQQTLLAFVQDMGITSSLFPEENCPPGQRDCAAAPPSQTQPNLTELKAGAMEVHGLALGVPARRGLEDPQALRGEEVFAQLGCPRCHVPQMETGTLEGWPELSNQTIHPYTDLLLHDMGPDLADGATVFAASGREWRTPPLWGLGLLETVNGHTFLLNDGRARDIPEAILWHGGEAVNAREAFRQLPKQDRAALVAFLQSL